MVTISAAYERRSRLKVAGVGAANTMILVEEVGGRRPLGFGDNVLTLAQLEAGAQDNAETGAVAD